jgi:hypothetical protein
MQFHSLKGICIVQRFKDSKVFSRSETSMLYLDIYDHMMNTKWLMECFIPFIMPGLLKCTDNADV